MIFIIQGIKKKKLINLRVITSMITSEVCSFADSVVAYTFTVRL